MSPVVRAALQLHRLEAFPVCHATDTDHPGGQNLGQFECRGMTEPTTVRQESTSKRLMSEPTERPPDDTLVTSSVAPHFPPEQESLYREVLTILNGENLPYAVAGAFALQQYTGIWRVTKDLDIFIPAEFVPRTMARLEADGFVCETLDPVWLGKVHRGEYFVDLITGMSNAAIVVDASWIERSKPALIVGVQTRVLAAEELLSSKLFVTRRERFDGADIAHIIYGTRGQLDWNRVLQLIGDHWEMLLWALILYRYVYPAQTEYVPERLWHDLLSRYMHLVSHPNRQERFRGSLVDDNMFAIDMNEWKLDNLLEEYRARRLQNEVPAALSGPKCAA